MSKIMDALESHVGPNDVVYSVTRRKKLRFWASLADLLLTGNFLNDAGSIVGNVERQYYLVAHESSATIVALHSGTVADSFDVPTWRPEMKDTFRKVVVGGFSYRKIIREN